MKSLTLVAPGKINLFLNVLGQRNNGYHEIKTCFQFINLQDKLEFQLTLDPSIVRKDDHPYTLPKDDLIVQAANLLKSNKSNQIKSGVTITLKKKFRLPLVWAEVVQMLPLHSLH